MRVARDPDAEDLKGEPPADLDEEAGALWKLDRYLADYLRCVVAIDENVGRLLDHLDETGQSEDTVVVHTSDQASSTPVTRASSSVSTGGTTSGSCTASRCRCRSSCATHGW